MLSTLPDRSERVIGAQVPLGPDEGLVIALGM
jgi:hypothetical protein